MNLNEHSQLLVKQIYEIGEWIGFETRNKYQILDRNGTPVAFAAEQQKGFWGFVLRQLLGHWRSFEIHIFSQTRQKIAIARQPFRFFFQRLEVFNQNGQSIGVLQQRFSIFSKKFDILNERGVQLMRMYSPLFRIWTFPIERHGRQVALIEKKWGGILTEVFTDTDKFLVQFKDSAMTESERLLILSAALFIDLRYFEAKANTRRGVIDS